MTDIAEPEPDDSGTQAGAGGDALNPTVMTQDNT